MKKSLLLLMGIFAMAASAQQATVTRVERLLKDVEGPAYYPQLNRAGDCLLFSSGPSLGLKAYDFQSNVATRVSNEAGTGINATFGPDGNVYYVTNQQNENHLIYRTGHRYDLTTRHDEVVLGTQHGAVTLERGITGIAMRGEKRNYRSSKNLGTAVSTQGAKLILTVDGICHEYSPVESHAGYLWASLSPNGQKVAFYAAGKGIVVTDLNGNVLAQPGNYEMPCWYDNDYLVAQNAKDDGHQFTSSQIMLLKADGTHEQALTPATSMTMHPTSAAGKIVYTTIDGNLYLMTININP